MANGIFRSCQKESRPLSAHLAQRFLRPLAATVQALPLDRLAADANSQARALVDAARVLPPQIGPLRAARAGDDGEARPTGHPGVKVGTTRFWMAAQTQGDVTLLDHWPDETGADLLPVDHGLGDWTRPAPGAQYDAAVELRRHQCLLDLWTIDTRGDDGPSFLYTSVDLTDDEIQQVGTGGRDPRADVQAALDRVRPIVLLDRPEPSVVKSAYNVLAILQGCSPDLAEEVRQHMAASGSVPSSQHWQLKRLQALCGETDEALSTTSGALARATKVLVALVVPQGRAGVVLSLVHVTCNRGLGIDRTAEVLAGALAVLPRDVG